MNRLAFSFLAALYILSSQFQSACAEHVVLPDEAMRSTHLVTKSIKWHTSLEDAQSEARKQGKLVFWMHLLGTVDGAT